MTRQSRAVTPVIGIILLVAITVILAATITVFVLGTGGDVQEPSPTIGQSSGELVEQSGSSGGTIKITHVAGSSVAVENMEVTVDATDACGAQERLINLPEDDSNNAGRFADSNVESGSISNSIISGQYMDLGVFDSQTSNQFVAGSYFQFRLTSGNCPLDDGDKITVRGVHLPSNSVVITETLTV